MPSMPFGDKLEECVVRPLTVGDMSSTPSVEISFNRAAWRDIQQSCPTLNRLHAHLSQGTRPSKKGNSPLVKVVRGYLQKDVRIAKDGLLVVSKT